MRCKLLTNKRLSLLQSEKSLFLSIQKNSHCQRLKDLQRALNYIDMTVCEWIK